MTPPRPWARVTPLLTAHHVGRFWALVDRRGPEECWEWTGHRARFGHGMFSVRGCGGPLGAHRLAFYLANGHMNDALLVCHHCDNPACCNPAHLYLGTQKDNMRDVRDRQRGRSHKTTHCPRGHELTEANTIEKLQGDGYIHRCCRRCHYDHSLRRYYNKLRPEHLRGAPPMRRGPKRKAA